MIGLAGIVAVVTGAGPAAITLSAVTVWEALSLLSNVVAPVVGAVIAVIIWLHKRINELENGQSNVESSVFGSKNDALNNGVLRAVHNLDDRLDGIQESIDNIRKRQKELERQNDDE